jgi:nucleotide-binding universal stress UspA family protein
MSKILGCLDGSIYASSVCDHAAWIAGRTGAAIELVHVLDHHREHASMADLTGAIGFTSNEVLMEQLTQVEEAQARVGITKGRLILQEAAQRLRAAGIADVSIIQRHGALVETLAELEVQASMIVMGKRGEAADFAKMHLGTNLERVARASKRPVLAASRAFKPIQRVLFAYDGGPSIRKAMEFVAQGTMMRGLEAQILSIGADDSARREMLERAKASALAGGMQAKTRIENGEPEAVISRIVEQEAVDLLVIGAYGHSRIRHLVIGSTTTAMLRSCLIPVLMFR